MSDQESEIEGLNRIFAQASRDLIFERARNGVRAEKNKELEARVADLEAKIVSLVDEVAFYKSMSGSQGEY